LITLIFAGLGTPGAVHRMTVIRRELPRSTGARLVRRRRIERIGARRGFSVPLPLRTCAPAAAPVVGYLRDGWGVEGSPGVAWLSSTVLAHLHAPAVPIHWSLAAGEKPRRPTG
jgi:hypothetical protein